MLAREDTLIRQINELRKRKRMSIATWEAACGVSHSILYRGKNKLSPTVYTVNRMLAPLGFTLAIVPIQYDLDERYQPYNKPGL